MPKHTAAERAKRTPVRGTRKVHKTMEEFKEGTPRSGSGQKVTSRKQAVAIALNVQREADKQRRKG